MLYSFIFHFIPIHSDSRVSRLRRFAADEDARPMAGGWAADASMVADRDPPVVRRLGGGSASARCSSLRLVACPMPIPWDEGWQAGVPPEPTLAGAVN